MRNLIAFLYSCQHAMAGLQYVQRLFSLDTLDTRFTTLSKVFQSNDQLLRDTTRAVPRDGGHDLRSRRAGHPYEEPNVPASKWRTPEFMVYAGVFLVAVPLMFKTVYDVSNRKLPSVQRLLLCSTMLITLDSLSSQLYQIRASALSWLDTGAEI